MAAFVDLRYGWVPTKTLAHCVCGAVFAVEHLLSCPRGGFPYLWYKEIKDQTATLMTEVCNDVQVEPQLQAIATETMSGWSANTADGTRSNMAANGFWGGRREKALIGIRM